MLAERCYSRTMTREDEPIEMTAFGHELWSMLQSKGRVSQAGIGRKIGEATGWTPSRQAISHWLYGTRDVPRDFVPAVSKAFDLSFEERCRLKELYFYGQGDTLEERYGKDRDSAQLKSATNESLIGEAEQEHSEWHEQRRQEKEGSGDSADTGDRTS